MNFNVTILQPIGYAPSLVFVEAANNVINVLRSLGHKVSFRKNRLLPHVINVVFGAHLELDYKYEIPEGTVIFNTE